MLSKEEVIENLEDILATLQINTLNTPHRNLENEKQRKFLAEYISQLEKES